MSNADNPMAEVRPAASLTANLLARRGAARPAMRRPALGNHKPGLSFSDDLGWNDMGEEEAPTAHADAHQAPADAPRTMATPIVPGVSNRQDEPAPVSPVNMQLQALAAEMSARSARRTRPASLAEVGRKAAFTLRLDPERHLRLRLLSAVSSRSAQQLLVEALDELIARNEKVKALAEQVEKPSLGA